MIPDLKELRAAAETATPGPWEARGLRVEVLAWRSIHPVASFSLLPDTPRGEANAAFVALANPEAILALIDAYERLAKAGDALAKQVDRHLTDEVWHFEDIETALVGYEAACAALSELQEDCPHQFSRQTGGHPDDCPAC